MKFRIISTWNGMHYNEFADFQSGAESTFHERFMAAFEELFNRVVSIKRYHDGGRRENRLFIQSNNFSILVQVPGPYCRHRGLGTQPPKIKPIWSVLKQEPVKVSDLGPGAGTFYSPSLFFRIPGLSFGRKASPLVEKQIERELAVYMGNISLYMYDNASKIMNCGRYTIQAWKAMQQFGDDLADSFDIF